MSRSSLYGPGTASGTFDYFTAEINGEEGSSTTDYLPSEDDNQLVQGVAGDANALGYFGLAYYEQNARPPEAGRSRRRHRLRRADRGDRRRWPTRRSRARSSSM